MYPFECISDFIFAEDNITKCDVILIPGASHPQLAERAAYLFNQGMAEYILVSGYANPNIPEYSSEAEFIKVTAVKLGVPEDKIICENKASNTFENAEFSLKILNDLNFKIEKFIIVCKASHSRRALLTYRNIFPPNVEFLMSPVTEKTGLNKDNWFTNTKYIFKVMTEVEKIGKYFKDKSMLLHSIRDGI